MKKVPILSRIFGNVSFRMIDGKQGKYSLGKNIKQHLISKNHWNSKDIRVWTFETKLEESASCQPKWACVLWILYVYKVVFFNFTVNSSTQYSENSEYCVDILNDVWRCQNLRTQLQSSIISVVRCLRNTFRHNICQ